MTRLSEILSGKGGAIPVSLAEGEQVVRIIDETDNRVKIETKPAQSDTDRKYNKK